MTGKSFAYSLVCVKFLKISFLWLDLALNIVCYLISKLESVDDIPVSLHFYFLHIFIHLILPLFPTSP